MAESTGVWLYAVAEQVDAAPLRAVTGVGGGMVRSMVSAGLTAIISDVELAQYGGFMLRRNLRDMTWVSAMSRVHHRVIGVAAEQGPVLPVRLATVYPGEADIAMLAARREADFRAILGRLGCRREWGVKAYPAEPFAAGSMTAREAVASAEAVHAELSGYAAETRLYPPRAPQPGGAEEVPVLDAAYLLDQTHGPDFAAAVTTLSARHLAVRLVLTGPWPAYSFAHIG
jgi:hypothetical protein